MSVTVIGQTYYVDATNGDDTNDGLSPANAWKTTIKVKNSTFQPGDSILFKCNETWFIDIDGVKESEHIVSSSGTQGLPITYSSYGNGLKPVITVKGSIAGWDTVGNWIQHIENIWYIIYSGHQYKHPKRIWLSGTEYARADSLIFVDSAARWYFDNSSRKLYICSSSNPASFYTNVEEAGLRSAAVFIKEKEYVTLKGLDIRGGNDASLWIVGSDHIIIEDCNVGWESGGQGIFVMGNYWENDKPSDHGKITGCQINSGQQELLPNTYPEIYPEDGIHVRNGVHYWEIYDNEIKDWGHTAVGLWQEKASTTVSHNKIYSNLIAGEKIAYGRGYSTQGMDGGCQYNEFYFNTIRNTRTRNQIGGDHNLVYYNIIDNVKNSTSGTAWGTGEGIWVTRGMTSADYVAHHNKILNNVIYNCDEAGIKIRSIERDWSIRFNEIKNNIILNCGNNSIEGYNNAGLFIDYPHVTDNIFQNNLVYKAGVNNVVYYHGSYISIAEFNALNKTNEDTIGNNIQSDPEFVDPVNSDFHLQSTSPCINAGIDVGIILDISGISVPQHGLPDIGAHEYSGEITLLNSAVNFPMKYQLFQNYPNPFNPETAINYQIPKLFNVNLKIYNINGQLVKTLVNEENPPGRYEVLWDGTNDSGLQVSSGIYVYRIKAEKFISAKKMILLK